TRASPRGSRASSRVAELIVAFDAPTGREALAVAARLPGLTWAKLGSMLYVREGPALVREFQARGVRVFLALKWHDIPGVGARAGPWLLPPARRGPAAPGGEQAPPVAPDGAGRGGATRRVVGRPITLAKDPEAVYRRLLETL